MIKPTVGRIVLYRPNGGYAPDRSLSFDRSQPLAAIVSYVWDDRTVNLMVIDQDGNVLNRTKVYLLQKDGTIPGGISYCEWE